uniref:Uncharacterized protein n=1 Tax=Lynx canadensis TaxID=61383 RepID=A0A667HNF9_LYNCA
IQQTRRRRERERERKKMNLSALFDDRMQPLVWKLLEILLRRPSVQTTCSGQCRCTVVCTLVRLGRGAQRHGRLGTEVAVSKEKTSVCFFKSHTQCFSSQVLHTRDQEALGDTAERGLLERRPVGKASLTAHLVCAQERRGGEPMICVHVREKQRYMCHAKQCI